MSIDKDLLGRLVAGRSPGDLFSKDGILSELRKALAKRALNTGLDIHLDEERAWDVPEGQNKPENGNGTSSKTVTTESGKVVLEIPCDQHRLSDPKIFSNLPNPEAARLNKAHRLCMGLRRHARMAATAAQSLLPFIHVSWIKLLSNLEECPLHFVKANPGRLGAESYRRNFYNECRLRSAAFPRADSQQSAPFQPLINNMPGGPS